MGLTRAFNPWSITWLAFGFFAAIAIVGRPDWSNVLWTEQAAGWAAAATTLVAVVVALYLGMAESRHRKQADHHRARAAATVFNENLAMIQTYLLAVVSYGRFTDEQEHIGSEALTLGREAQALRPIIEDRFAVFLGDLPPEVGRIVVLADQRFELFRRNDLVLTAPADRRVAVRQFAESARYVALAVGAAGELTQQLVAPGIAPAWREFAGRPWTAWRAGERLAVEESIPEALRKNT